MRPKIAVSIAARNTSEAIEMTRKAIDSGGDLVEIRLDFLEEEGSLQRIRRASKKQLIATFRSPRRPNISQLMEKKCAETLICAAKVGFDYVDIELETKNVKSLVDTLQKLKAKTIVSHHDYEATATEVELNRLVRTCRSTGASLIKVVTTATSLEDNLRLLAFIRKQSRKSRLICFAMGRNGILSRILSPIFGASFTFASLDDEQTVAPGQIPVEKMRRIYRDMGY